MSEADLLCCTCKEYKPRSAFHRDNRNSRGYRDRCKSCRVVLEGESGRIRAKDWYHKHKEEIRPRVRKSAWKSKFGVTPEQYAVMLEAQNSRCAICRREQGCEKRAFSIDHDHKTGRIRGLLCSICNRGIGMLRDDPDILRAAIEYLEKNSEDQ